MFLLPIITSCIPTKQPYGVYVEIEKKLRYFKLEKKSKSVIASDFYYQSDKYSGDIVFDIDIPDSYDGYPVEYLGVDDSLIKGYNFIVYEKSVFCSDIHANPTYYFGIFIYSMFDNPTSFTFNLNIGANVKDISFINYDKEISLYNNTASSYYISDGDPIRDHDFKEFNKNDVPIVVNYNISDKNNYLFTEDGILYDKETYERLSYIPNKVLIYPNLNIDI